MKTRAKAVGLLLLLVGTACLALMAAHTAEPKYKSQPLSHWIELNGQPLSYWLDLNLRADRHGMVPVGRIDIPEQYARDFDEARAAITTIGTNGLPYLTRWIQYQPPLWGTRFIPWTPRRLRHKLYRINQDRADRAEAAMQALVALGTNAVPAIPQLAALAMKTNILDRDIAWRAKVTLSFLGPPALPALLNLWSNAGPQERASLIYGRIQAQLIRSGALEAVPRIAPELLTNTIAK